MRPSGERTTVVAVHAWLDVACPWCWIAKRRFEEATRDFEGEVEVTYHSWELAPKLPADYLSSEVDFLQLLYAGTTPEEAQQKCDLVRSTGAMLGLAYDFDRVQHTNTFLAHQLLHHAKDRGIQKPMLESLFSAFFERGLDLRSVDQLIELAVGCGLDAGSVREGLVSGRYAEAVRADRVLATQAGVTNIPTYVIAGGPPIHGAKRPAVLLAALREAATESR